MRFGVRPIAWQNASQDSEGTQRQGLFGSSSMATSTMSLMSMADDLERRSGGKQGLEIAPVEAVLGVLVKALEGALEAFDRVLGAFRMREVGREEEELGAALADDGPGVFRGEGREPHGAADELRRRDREAADDGVGL